MKKPRKSPTSNWKGRERQVARYFGAERNRLSGSSGLTHESSSDSTHPEFFIETKVRQGHYARELWDKCKSLCKGKDKGKLPIVALVSKSKPGFLICVHSDDFFEVACKFILARDGKTHEIEEDSGGEPE